MVSINKTITTSYTSDTITQFVSLESELVGVSIGWSAVVTPTSSDPIFDGILGMIVVATGSDNFETQSPVINKTYQIDSSDYYYNGFSWIRGTSPTESGTGDGKQVLTSPLTVYISETGSDSNNGLTTSTAFLTLAGAQSAIREQYNVNGYTVTYQVLDGTYSWGQVDVYGFAETIEENLTSGNVVFQGNDTNPENVILQGTFLNFSGAVSFNISGFTFDGTTVAAIRTFIQLNRFATVSYGVLRFINSFVSGQRKTCFAAQPHNTRLVFASNADITLVSGWFQELFVASTGALIDVGGNFTFENALTINASFYCRTGGAIAERGNYFGANLVSGSKTRINRGGTLQLRTSLADLPGTDNYWFQNVDQYYQDGEINGLDYTDLWEIATLSGNISMDAYDLYRSVYTATTNLTVNLRTTLLDRDTEMIIVNSPSSTGDISLHDLDTSTTLLTLSPSEIAFIYRRHYPGSPSDWYAFKVSEIAESISYDSSGTSLTATNVKQAINQVHSGNLTLIGATDDAAAALAGVAVGQLYYNSGTGAVVVRLV